MVVEPKIGLHAFRASEINSKYVQQIFDTRHSYGRLLISEDAVLHKIKKGKPKKTLKYIIQGYTGLAAYI
jgi:hypothetical protein